MTRWKSPLAVWRQWPKPKQLQAGEGGDLRGFRAKKPANYSSRESRWVCGCFMGTFSFPRICSRSNITSTDLIGLNCYQNQNTVISLCSAAVSRFHFIHLIGQDGGISFLEYRNVLSVKRKSSTAKGASQANKISLEGKCGLQRQTTVDCVTRTWDYLLDCSSFH